MRNTECHSLLSVNPFRPTHGQFIALLVASRSQIDSQQDRSELFSSVVKLVPVVVSWQKDNCNAQRVLATFMGSCIRLLFQRRTKMSAPCHRLMTLENGMSCGKAMGLMLNRSLNGGISVVGLIDFSEVSLPIFVQLKVRKKLGRSVKRIPKISSRKQKPFLPSFPEAHITGFPIKRKLFSSPLLASEVTNYLAFTLETRHLNSVGAHLYHIMLLSALCKLSSLRK